jgi:hypothetical protein
MSKLVLYVDIDDTLLMWRSTGHRGKYIPKAAPGAGDFLRWAVNHFEVRWLSMWCRDGQFQPGNAEELAQLLGVEVEFITAIPTVRFTDPDKFRDECRKTDGIDFTEDFVWIEDDILQSEKQVLRDHKMGLRHIPCNVTANPNRLLVVWEQLRKRVANAA